MIDLHTHSTFSDGTYTPEELVDICAEAELTAVALTDHDTVAGIPRFMAACKAKGITLYGAGVIKMSSKEEADRAFEYAKEAGLELIVGDPGIL